MAYRGCTHFKALVRKNFINWKRTPICSILEVLLAVVLMSGLVTFRHFVDTTTVDTEGMLEKKSPLFPSLEWEVTRRGGDWSSNKTTSPHYVNAMVMDMMTYDNKSSRIPDDKNTTDFYEVQYDILGPQFLLPSQCLKKTSFLIPRRTSPWIALVGNKTEWR